MTDFKDSLEEILEESVKAYNLEILGHRESGQTKLIQSIIDLIDKEIDLAKKAERNRLTAQAIKRKMLESDAQEISFTLQIDKEAEHQFYFVQDENHWQVAVDGKNIVSRGRQRLGVNK